MDTHPGFDVLHGLEREAVSGRWRSDHRHHRPRRIQGRRLCRQTKREDKTRRRDAMRTFTAVELFGEGVTSAPADDPLFPLPINTDAKTGITFKVMIRRLGVRSYEPLLEKITEAQGLPAGQLRDDAMADADAEFLERIVVGWEGLNLSNYYETCNDNTVYANGIIDEMLVDPKRCFNFNRNLLVHIYRNAWPARFREPVMAAMRRSVNRVYEKKAESGNGSGPSVG